MKAMFIVIMALSLFSTQVTAQNEGEEKKKSTLMVTMGVHKSENPRDQALLTAITKGDIETVKFELENDGDVNAKDTQGLSALIIALVNRRLEAAKVLISAGANINEPDPTFKDSPVIWLVRRANFSRIIDADRDNPADLLKVLIDAGADLNYEKENGDTALSLCNNDEIKQILIDAGATLSLKMSWINAAKSGDAATLKKLAGLNADVNLRITGGTTGLMVAAREGQLQAVKTLLSIGADPNISNDNGSTALMLAVAGGNIEIVKALLAAGANAQAADNDGDSVLFYASSTSNPEIIKLLLKHGANPLFPNRAGKTVLSVAQTERNEVVIKALKAAGVKY